MLTHHVAEHEHTVHVVFIVLQGLGHRLTHGFEASEVDDSVNLVVGEDFVHGSAVADIGFHEGNFLANNLLNATNCFGLRVHEVVDDHNGVASLVQLNKRVATDITGTTCKENVHKRLNYRVKVIC